MKRTDEAWMRRALQLASKGRGRTSPNPMVGAVLVRNGKIVGEGYHARAGESHAEILALRAAGGRAKGASLYINLEPCTHTGRTPPCAPRVIRAGVRSVVVGMEDPNPLVRGRGVASMKRAGIDVKVGILGNECRELNEAFCKYIVNQEPFVILKAASTLDGKIATGSGESKWITGEASRRYVHRVRSEVDGILVGIDTIVKDDPLLTSRIRGGRDPLRIILDSGLRISEDAKVIDSSPSRTIVFTTERGRKRKQKRLEQKGVRVVVTGSREGKVDLKACLSYLGRMGLMSLLVEGGSRVNGSFLDQGLVDKILLFFAPKLIGDGKARSIFEGKCISSLREAKLLKEVKVRRIGEDILVTGYLDRS